MSETPSLLEVPNADGPWAATAGTDALEGESVLDLSSGIAGGFCTKMLADAGALVVKVEDADGDVLRRWRRGPWGEDALLFCFLAQSKRSIVVNPRVEKEVERLRQLASCSDIIVWSAGSKIAELPELSPLSLSLLAPHAVVCSITPFGRTGPWSGRPATDLTLQAWAGGIGHRGGREGPPVRAGGAMSEWATASFATVSILTARHRARITGRGDVLDVSMLESVALTGALNFPVTFLSIAGRPMREGRIFNVPAIHPASDGWAGFMVLTGQQWLDFCVLIERPEWMEDESLLFAEARADRYDELVTAIDAWTRRHTVAAILERAGALRVPAAPLGNGSLTPIFEHVALQGLYERDPLNRFLQPAPHYRMDPGRGRLRPLQAPQLGESELESFTKSPAMAVRGTSGDSPQGRPLDGLRVADLTAFWAGPVVGRFLAMMGADVIRVESPRKLDGMRFMTPKSFDEDQWWEWAPMMQGANVGKRHLGLDLSTERGREVLIRLVEHCDVLIENYTPRVLDAWNLDHRRLLDVNSRLVVLRMPAFGLEGPWRDRPGYAQTMEQISGMAWVTGFPDGPPIMPNGQCDPIGGNMALIALLLGLEQRRRSGRGMLVECPLVMGALTVAAEQVVEYSGHGQLLGRLGNRDHREAPQGVYPCLGSTEEDSPNRWVAIAVADDRQWGDLRRALGEPSWAMDTHLEDAEGRWAAHDTIDRELWRWCSVHTDEQIVDRLWSFQVPVAKVLMPHEQAQIKQLHARGFFEDVTHPVTGTSPHATHPVKFASLSGPLHLRPAPTLGQHNQVILHDLIGLSPEEIIELEQAGVIGTRPPKDEA